MCSSVAVCSAQFSNAYNMDSKAGLLKVSPESVPLKKQNVSVCVQLVLISNVLDYFKYQCQVQAVITVILFSQEIYLFI